MTTPKDLAYLIAKDDIKEVLARYFQGLDRSDRAQVKDCFTDDVVSHYDGRSSMRSGDSSARVGIDALMNSLVTFDRHQSGEWKITTHFMGNFSLLSLEDNLAQTETNAIAYIVTDEHGTNTVTMRSLRYLDRLRKTPQGWKICARTHTLDWSAQTPTNFHLTMPQRVSVIHG